MSRGIVVGRSHSPAHHSGRYGPASCTDRSEVMSPIIVERHGSRTWAVVFCIVACVLMFLSFASWVAGEFLRYSERESIRAHELSMRAVELAHASAVSSGSDMVFGAGHVVVLFFLCAGVLLVLRGLR